MIFDIVEQQRRSVLTRDFSGDRAELFIPIDFGADPLQVLPFVEIIDPLAQISKCHGYLSSVPIVDVSTRSAGCRRRDQNSRMGVMDYCVSKLTLHYSGTSPSATVPTVYVLPPPLAP